MQKLLLTDDEKIILRNLPKEYKYITRDKLGTLYVYKTKPRKDIDIWIGDGWSSFRTFNHLLQFIKWEDEEPYLISDLLNYIEKE